MYIEQQLTYDALFDFLEEKLTENSWTIRRRGAEANSPDVLIAECAIGGCIILVKDYNETVGTYNVFLDMCTTFDETSPWYAQPNSKLSQLNAGEIRPYSYPYLDQATFASSFYAMFSINERRLILTAKNGMYYNSSYIGRLLPYSSPENYPAPFYICGNMYSENCPSYSTSYANTTRYDVTTDINANLTNWGYVMQPNAQWVLVNREVGYNDEAMAWPECFENLDNWGADVDGNPTMFPVTVISAALTNNDGAHLGVLDGVYKVSGQGMSPESVIIENGLEHVCIPDVFRAGNGDYFAIAKE